MQGGKGGHPPHRRSYSTSEVPRLDGEHGYAQRLTPPPHPGSDRGRADRHRGASTSHSGGGGGGGGYSSQRSQYNSSHSHDEDEGYRGGYAGDRDRGGSAHGGGLYQAPTAGVGLRRSRSRVNVDHLLNVNDSNPSGDSSDGGDGSGGGGGFGGRVRRKGGKDHHMLPPVGAPMGMPPKHARHAHTAVDLRAVEEGYYEKSSSSRGGRHGLPVTMMGQPGLHRASSLATMSGQGGGAGGSGGGGGNIGIMMSGTGLDDTLGCRCSFKLPSNSQLCRIFAVMTAMIFLLNASSCGFFYCYGGGYPGGGRGISGVLHSDLHQLYERSTLAHTQANMVMSAYDHDGTGGVAPHGAGGIGGGGDFGSGLIDSGAGVTPNGEPAPLMIPRIIHQTYKSNAVPDQVRGLMASWDRLNPGWEIRFYDDAMCRQFVRTEFPEYYDAYLALPKDVERSDFFRYLIVLHTGGVYADIDTECRKPLDRFLRATDTLVVGWENEFRTDEMAYSRHFVRRRQVLNWVFAGAPGHPALRETCDHIARHARTIFTNNTNRDTLERTGPGIFTDIVLRQFWRHSRANEIASEGLAPWGTSAWALEAAGGRRNANAAKVNAANSADASRRRQINNIRGVGDVGSEDSSDAATAVAAAEEDAAAAGAGAAADSGIPAAGVAFAAGGSAGTGKLGGGGGGGKAGASGAGGDATLATEVGVDAAAAAAVGADPWTVRVLPKVAFGTHPRGEDGVSQDDPGVLVAHHFLGSWKSRKGWTSQKKGWFGWARLFMHTIKRDVPQYRAQLSHADPLYSMPAVNQDGAYPVSTVWEPPFDMLTHLIGSNASDEVMDVSGAALTARGRWQPGRVAPRQPTSAEALVGSLSAHRRSAALLDVGAGLGYFSLAAAARGHRVISYEWGESAGSLLRASIAHNGFGSRVELRTTRLGGRGEAYCRALAEHEIAAAAAAAEARAGGDDDQSSDGEEGDGFYSGGGAGGEGGAGGGGGVDATYSRSGSGGGGAIGVSRGSITKVMERLEAAEVARLKAADALEMGADPSSSSAAGGGASESSGADAPDAAPGGAAGAAGAEAPSGAPIKGSATSEGAARSGGSGGGGLKKGWEKVWQPGSGGTMAGWITYPWAAKTSNNKRSLGVGGIGGGAGGESSGSSASAGAGGGVSAPPAPSSYPDAEDEFPCEVAEEAGIQSIDDVVSPEDDIAAMRISASGWERHVIEGARRLLTRRPPPIILLELTPREARVSSTTPDPLESTQRLLEWLFSLGYTDVAHSGHVCDERWRNITRYVNSRGGLGLELREAMRQPTWCHSARSNLPVLVSRAHPTLPESILLHHTAGAKRLERERKDRLAALSAAAAARAKEKQEQKQEQRAMKEKREDQRLAKTVSDGGGVDSSSTEGSSPSSSSSSGMGAAAADAEAKVKQPVILELMQSAGNGTDAVAATAVAADAATADADVTAAAAEEEKVVLGDGAISAAGEAKAAVAGEATPVLVDLSPTPEDGGDKGEGEGEESEGGNKGAGFDFHGDDASSSSSGSGAGSGGGEKNEGASISDDAAVRRGVEDGNDDDGEPVVMFGPPPPPSLPPTETRESDD